MSPSRLLRFGVVLAVAVSASLVWASGALAATWNGSGTGSTTVVSNGAGDVAEFSYNVDVPCCASGNWTFSTHADRSGPVKLRWTYNGYHAFFAVTVSLSAFVTHGGTTVVPLVNAGPVNCCTPPSGGFSYTGTTTLNVAAGDTYGFTMSGTNFDSDGRLIGDLRILLPGAPPDAGPPRAAYCAAEGNTTPSGAAIAPGTFLNLIYKQPETDAHYKGATPANFVEGKGLTCDPPPPGYALGGLAGDAQHVAGGLYAYYKPAA